MPVLQPINWQLLEDAIYAWFEEATGIEVVWANQDAPQPPYPFGTLNVIAGPTKVGGDDEVRSVTLSPAVLAPLPPIEMEYAGPREMTVSCQINVGAPFDGDPATHARALMTSAQSSLGLESVRVLLRAAGLAVIQELPVQSFDLQIADAWVARSQMDVRFGLAASVVEKVQAIENVHIESPALNVDDDFGLGG